MKNHENIDLPCKLCVNQTHQLYSEDTVDPQLSSFRAANQQMPGLKKSGWVLGNLFLLFFQSKSIFQQ